jgi:hypothetical protein
MLFGCGKCGGQFPAERFAGGFCDACRPPYPAKTKVVRRELFSIAEAEVNLRFIIEFETDEVKK